MNSLHKCLFGLLLINDLIGLNITRAGKVILGLVRTEFIVWPDGFVYVVVLHVLVDEPVSCDSKSIGGLRGHSPVLGLWIVDLAEAWEAMEGAGWSPDWTGLRGLIKCSLEQCNCCVSEFVNGNPFFDRTLIHIKGPRFLIGDAWNLKNVLELPSIIKRLFDKQRSRDILNQFLGHQTEVWIILTVLFHALLIREWSFLINKWDNRLDVGNIVSFACFHWRIIYEKAGVWKSKHFSLWICILDILTDGFKPGKSS